MHTFLKAQAALIAGSIADFLLALILVNAFDCGYVPANVLGNIAGAIAQFVISRSWAFASPNKSIRLQVLKFLIMWAGNTGLSALAIYLLTSHLHIPFLPAKLIVSIVLGTTYTYFISRFFVFG